MLVKAALTQATPLLTGNVAVLKQVTWFLTLLKPRHPAAKLGLGHSTA